MQIDLKEVFDWLLDNWASLTVIVSVFFEITPIKLNPIKALLRWIGKAINGEVIQRISGLEARADQQRKSIDENEMDRIRWEVLDFANACRNHIKHTKDEFQHIIALNEKYHKLLEKYNDENGVFDAEYTYILELYHECQRSNSFL